MYHLFFEKRVLKDLEKISDAFVIKIDNSIRLLSKNPLPIGSKKLIGERYLYRIRQGDYRIIYAVDHKSKEVRLLAVRHRREVYRK